MSLALCSVASQQRISQKPNIFKVLRHLKHFRKKNHSWQWSVFLVNGSWVIDDPASRVWGEKRANTSETEGFDGPCMFWAF